MAGKGGFAVTVTLVDGASKQIDAINKRIAAMQAPALRVQRSLAKFADVSGLQTMGRAFQGVARYALEVFRNISRIVEPLAAITGALSVAGLVRLTTAFGDFGAKLEYAARRIGITSDSLQALQGAARLSGASAESLTSGMRTLGDTLTDAVAGRAPEAVVMLNTLGIAFRDGTGHARKAIDVLPEIADKIAALKNPALQARVAVMLLGGAAEELLPFLRRGSAGIAEYTELARKYGVVNEAAAAQAIVLQQAQTKLSLSVEGLVNSIGEKLAPILSPLLTQMADWIAANRQWIAAGIAEKVKELADWLKSIDWKGVGASIQDWATKAKGVVDAFGGIKHVAEGFVIFMATKWAVGVIGPVVQLIQLIAIGLVGAFKLATLAAQAFTTNLQSNPAFRTLTALLALYDKINNFGSPLSDMAPGDPLWNAVPEDQQRQYPNSPYNQPGGKGYTGGGGAPGGGGGGGSATPDRLSFARDKLATDLGISKDAASGIVSNLDAESGVKGVPTGLVPYSDRSAYGFAQWTGDRRVEFDKYAATHGGRDSDQANFGFLEEELKTKYPALLAQLRSGKLSAGQAANLMFQYESGGAPSLEGFRGGHVAGADRIANLPSANAPNGVPKVGPTFGPQTPPATVSPPLQMPTPGVSPQRQASPASGAPNELGRPANDPGAPPTPPVAAGPNQTVGGGTGAANSNVTKLQGRADLNVNFRNAPPGTTTAATSDGSLFGPPKISMAMPGSGP